MKDVGDPDSMSFRAEREARSRGIAEGCHSERAVGESRNRGGLSFRAEREARSRGIAIVPVEGPASRSFEKLTQMSLISQITQVDSVHRSRPICEISVICAICVRFWKTR